MPRRSSVYACATPGILPGELWMGASPVVGVPVRLRQPEIPIHCGLHSRHVDAELGERPDGRGDVRWLRLFVNQARQLRYPRIATMCATSVRHRRRCCVTTASPDKSLGCVCGTALRADRSRRWAASRASRDSARAGGGASRAQSVRRHHRAPVRPRPALPRARNIVMQAQSSNTVIRYTVYRYR